MTCPCDIAQIAHNTLSMSSTSYELITFTNSYAVNNNTGSRSEASLIRPRPPFVRVLVTAASGKVTYLPGNVPILFMLTLVRILYYHHVILRTSPSSLYTCRVFITVNYMQPNLRATEVPGCSRVTCLLLAVIGISTQDLVLEFAVIVNGYSPRL